MPILQSKRLLSVDVIRGLAVAAMLLVNNPGSWQYLYRPLAHAKWNGMTPTDFVFPFFMFVMGLSIYLSLMKFDFKPTSKIIQKVIRRAVLLFFIGIFLGYISLSLRTFHSLSTEQLGIGTRLLQSFTNFQNLRILGVFQRLAICYLIASLVAIFVRHKYIPYIVGSVLIVYFVLLLVRNGFEYNENNIASIIDRAILGASHMYKDNGIDPEGLFSTISAACHVLIGFCFGRLIMLKKDNNQKIQTLFIAGSFITLFGLLFSYACPLNKKIWSPTFALVSCGTCAVILALLIWLIDIKGCKKWCLPFKVFGVNALFSYLLGTAITIAMINIKVPFGDKMVSLAGLAYTSFFQHIISPYFGSLFYAIIFVAVVWLVSYLLYRKKVYIKL